MIGPEMFNPNPQPQQGMGGGYPVEAMMAGGIAPEQMALLARQMEIAEALRNKQAPQGRQAGRIYTAANPLEMIADLGQKYRQARRIQELRQQEQAQLAALKGGREKFAEAYTNALRKPSAPSVSGPVPML